MSILWGLEPEDWELSSEHTYLGPVTLRQLAREQSQHDLEHLWAARQVHQQAIDRAEVRG